MSVWERRLDTFQLLFSFLEPKLRIRFKYARCKTEEAGQVFAATRSSRGVGETPALGTWSPECDSLWHSFGSPVKHVPSQKAPDQSKLPLLPVQLLQGLHGLQVVLESPIVLLLFNLQQENAQNATLASANKSRDRNKFQRHQSRSLGKWQEIKVWWIVVRPSSRDQESWIHLNSVPSYLRDSWQWGIHKH